MSAMHGDLDKNVVGSKSTRAQVSIHFRNCLLYLQNENRIVDSIDLILIHFTWKTNNFTNPNTRRESVSFLVLAHLGSWSAETVLSWD